MNAKITKDYSTGWQPCDTDGRALPGTSADYANWQLAQEGVLL